MAFTETSQAITELATSERYGYGEHTRYDPMVGSMGVSVGYEAYDPARHDPFAIDQFSIMGMVTDEPQVRVVQPEKPFRAVIVRDETQRRELVSVGETKRLARLQVAHDLFEAMPMTDYTEHIVLSDAQESNSIVSRGESFVRVDDRTEVLRRAADLALEGALVFVVSDFHNMEAPAMESQQTQNPFVAVKVNQVEELVLMPKRGYRSLSRMNEVNTNNPQLLQQANNRLLEVHRRTLDVVASYGGQVALVGVMDGFAATFDRQYDTRATDKRVATAIHKIA